MNPFTFAYVVMAMRPDLECIVSPDGDRVLITPAKRIPGTTAQVTLFEHTIRRTKGLSATGTYRNVSRLIRVVERLLARYARRQVAPAGVGGTAP